jgi:hypothetical protein
LEDITKHPWFKSQNAIRPVGKKELSPKSLKITDKKISKNDYAVVSKPSIVNKAEAGEMSMEGKLNNINLSPS